MWIMFKDKYKNISYESILSFYYLKLFERYLLTIYYFFTTYIFQ